MKLLNNLDAVKKAAVQIKSFSQTETHRGVAWSCMVYFGGKKLGLVSNDGSGKMTQVDFGADQQKQIVDALKSAAYTLELTLGDNVIDEPDTVEEWLEFAVGQIGDEQKELKGLKRRTKTHTFVEKRSEPRLAAYGAIDTPKTRATLVKQLGEDLVRFMNDTIQAY